MAALLTVPCCLGVIISLIREDVDILSVWLLFLIFFDVLGILCFLQNINYDNTKKNNCQIHFCTYSLIGQLNTRWILLAGIVAIFPGIWYYIKHEEKA